MTSGQFTIDERYANILTVVLHHMRAERYKEAAAVIDAIPDNQIRDFTLYLALHVNRDLGVIRDQARDHMMDVMARDTPSQN
jgi:hypothetical protein